MSNWRVSSAFLALCLFPFVPTGAHHSGTMFDDRNPITLSGTVRQFQWTNPHCYIQLTVPDAKGKDKEWSIEMAAPTYLYKLGWRPATLKVGQKITVKARPLRSGAPGALVLQVHNEAGELIGKQP
jgi:hypothetical protein